MRFNFFNELRALRASIVAEPYIQLVVPHPGFPIHPSTGELAEELLVDSEVLKNETYEPGLYDEDGDYYPQYTDDPSKMPEYFEPAPLESGDTAPESLPAESAEVSADKSKSDSE